MPPRVSPSATGVWPSSSCRRPARSRCAVSAGASPSPTTARSTTISRFAPSSRPRRSAELARAFRYRNAALRCQAVGRRGGASSASTACLPSRYGTHEARTLTLARDRFGEKPLYLRLERRRSRVRLRAEGACRASGLVRRRSTARALTSFMRYSYVPAPSTIWSGIRKLPPASFVIFAADTAPGTMPQPVAYWSRARAGRRRAGAADHR